MGIGMGDGMLPLLFCCSVVGVDPLWLCDGWLVLAGVTGFSATVEFSEAGVRVALLRLGRSLNVITIGRIMSLSS